MTEAHSIVTLALVLVLAILVLTVLHEPAQAKQVEAFATLVVKDVATPINKSIIAMVVDEYVAILNTVKDATTNINRKTLSDQAATKVDAKMNTAFFKDMADDTRTGLKTVVTKLRKHIDEFLAKDPKSTNKQLLAALTEVKGLNTTQ